MPVDDNQIAYRAFVAKGNDLLVGWRVIPALGGVSGGELDNHKTWVRPLAFQTCKIAATDDEFSPEGSDRGRNCGSVLREAGLVTDCFSCDHVRLGHGGYSHRCPAQAAGAMVVGGR